MKLSYSYDRGELSLQLKTKLGHFFSFGNLGKVRFAFISLRHVKLQTSLRFSHRPPTQQKIIHVGGTTTS